PLYQRARELLKETLGEKHPDYAVSLNNLARLHESLGDYRAALPLLKQARDILKELVRARHPPYVTSLNNLAGLYRSLVPAHLPDCVLQPRAVDDCNRRAQQQEV